jgi:hypothetical protein
MSCIWGDDGRPSGGRNANVSSDILPTPSPMIGDRPLPSVLTLAAHRADVSCALLCLRAVCGPFTICCTPAMPIGRRETAGERYCQEDCRSLPALYVGSSHLLSLSCSDGLCFCPQSLYLQLDRHPAATEPHPHRMSDRSAADMQRAPPSLYPPYHRLDSSSGFPVTACSSAEMECEAVIYARV